MFRSARFLFQGIVPLRMRTAQSVPAVPLAIDLPVAIPGTIPATAIIVAAVCLSLRRIVVIVRRFGRKVLEGIGVLGRHDRGAGQYKRS